MKTMTFKDLTSKLTLLEGGKSNVKVGDVKEILSKLSKMMVEDPMIISLLIKNGSKN